MINKKILGVMAFALVLIVGSCPAFAASSSTATQTVTVTVSPTISISVSPNVSMTVLADGIPVSDATTTVTSQSNKAIDLTISALVPYLDGAATSDTSALTLNNIAFASSGNTGTVSSGTLGTTASTLYTNLPRAAKSGTQTFQNTFTVTAPFGTTQGTYNTTVTYTAVQHS
jgi:hypothetical protein